MEGSRSRCEASGAQAPRVYATAFESGDKTAADAGGQDHVRYPRLVRSDILDRAGGSGLLALVAAVGIVVGALAALAARVLIDIGREAARESELDAWAGAEPPGSPHAAPGSASPESDTRTYH